ncbi:MAG: 3-deoxy-manno-octulosonate cytidylyltransferase [Calditrichaeota bacterium]|nr:3-deoxy-manno-octulosonate cytidylyltransferase [Calditrichota bacterium]
MKKIIGVIPARYGSTRLEGKMLLKISGKAMIQRVYEQVSKAQLLQEVIVATDDERIKSLVESFGGNVVMTSPHHRSGTDRVAEAVRNFDFDYVINVQGDQPFVDPKMIDELTETILGNNKINMATIVKRIRKEDMRVPSVVKTVIDKNNNALYFSRSLIPYPLNKNGLVVYEHIGLYVYKNDFLQLISQFPVGHLERIENLEQLRVLENGYDIYVVETKCENPHFSGFGVDTKSELEEAEQMLLDSPQFQ